ncbi:hypothetical protein [Nonomuraea sp. B19D2]|uniref:hypothetical protein n=1 Tax=Nonomuraea sp. B19D2 TaxID=3159561 RepID=UPI0032D9AEB9
MRPGVQDRRAVSALADLDPQDVRMLLGLMRKAYDIAPGETRWLSAGSPLDTRYADPESQALSAELVSEAGGIGFPPTLLGFAQDTTMAWLLSYESPDTRDAYRREIARWFAFCTETGLDPLKARKKHGDAYKRWLELQAEAPIPAKTMQAIPS